jgi:hypothetical protein
MATHRFIEPAIEAAHVRFPVVRDPRADGTVAVAIKESSGRLVDADGSHHRASEPQIPGAP